MKDIIKKIYRKIIPTSIRKIIWKQKHKIFFKIDEGSFKKQIRGSNNRIISNGGHFQNINFDIIGENNTIIIEEGVTLNDVTFMIRGNNNKAVIEKNVWYHMGGNINQWGHNTYLKIGSDTTIEQANFGVYEDNSKIVIGSNCMLSRGIYIRTGDNHLIFDVTTNKRINFAKDIIIGNHVWISEDCNILKGVNISEDSIIGYGSIVTKKFTETNVIIAGNPAKIVKKNVNFSSEECPPNNIKLGNFEYRK